MQYAGAETVINTTPPPRIALEMENCATVLEVTATTIPTITTIAPINMALRRPMRSEMGAPIGAATMAPLSVSTGHAHSLHSVHREDD